MAKPELGTKRLCGNCGAKFYDLSKDPIVCPKCHTVLELAAVSSARRGRSRPLRARRRPRRKKRRSRRRPPEAEFVSLEDADAEAQGKKTADGEAVEGAEDEVELEDERLDDAAFIEEQEEERRGRHRHHRRRRRRGGDLTLPDRDGNKPHPGHATESVTVHARDSDAIVPTPRPAWGHSSVGRALEWHSRGRGFDSPGSTNFSSIDQ